MKPRTGRDYPKRSEAYSTPNLERCSMRARIASFLRAAASRRRFESEMEQELRGHLRARAGDLIAQGVPRREAALQARREFGAVESIKDECRDSKGLTWPDALLRDFRFAFRVL